MRPTPPTVSVPTHIWHLKTVGSVLQTTLVFAKNPIKVTTCAGESKTVETAIHRGRPSCQQRNKSNRTAASPIRSNTHPTVQNRPKCLTNYHQTHQSHHVRPGESRAAETVIHRGRPSCQRRNKNNQTATDLTRSNTHPMVPNRLKCLTNCHQTYQTSLSNYFLQ